MHTLALKTAFYFWLNKMFQVDPNSISGKGENWLHPCFATHPPSCHNICFCWTKSSFPGGASKAP